MIRFLPIFIGLAVLATRPALAGEVCDLVRPNWDGGPVSAWDEALLLFGSPAALVLMVATAFAARFRSAWGGLAVFVGWSFLVSSFTIYDPTGGQRPAATAEGCIGSPTIFIVIVLAMAVALVLYTTPRRDKPDTE